LKILAAFGADEGLVDLVARSVELVYYAVTVTTDVNHEDHLLKVVEKDPDRLLLACCKLCARGVEARPSRSLDVKTPEVRGLGV